MKRISLAVLLGLALSTLSVRATTLFFDNFQQFPNGTVLTTTNYVPVVGPLATIETNDDGLASTTVVASNFLGSTRAFFNLGSVPYAHRYRGELAEELTNQVLTLNWKMWIQAVKTPAATLGGIGLDLVTTNLFIDGGGTNLDNNIFLFFNDAGQVFAFTNNASETDPTTTVVQIGSWSSLAGTVMTNRLVLNHPAGTFSFSINGTTLTNMPIPGFITNIFDRIHLGVFEGFTGMGQQNSTGNRFALDDVWLTSGAASTNHEVRSFIAAAKGQFFEQISTNLPSLSTTGFAFIADVDGVESNSVASATVQVPGGAEKTLQRFDPGDSTLHFEQDFTTKPALNAAYTNGTYTMTILTLGSNLYLPALNLPADNYPTNAPHVSNFTAAQAIDSTGDFTLSWDAFSGGTSSDFIQAELDDASGSTVFSSGSFEETNALNGTATEVVIPGGTLAAGTNYFGQLLFAKRGAFDTNAVPGAVGITTYFKNTEFSVSTAPLPGAVCTLAPALATNDVGTLHTVTATVTSNSVAVAGVTVNFVVTGVNSITTNLVTDSGGQTSFGYTSSSTGTDTIQASGAISGLAFTGTAVQVWLPLPVAHCHDVTVSAGANCQASVSASQVDNGSSGTSLSYVLNPSGPYSLGTTNVTLTVTDNGGGTSSCSANIHVVDSTPPTVTCPSDIVTNVPFGQTSAVVNYPAPTISDNCSGTSTNFVPSSGSTFALGTNQVTVTATDGSGNTNSCHFNVIVAETPAQADLVLTKASNVATASLNNAFGYTLTVTNQGPQAATGAQLVDTLPGGVVFSNATTSVGSCTNVGGVLTCDFGTLANGAGATVSVVVTPTNPAVASACNTATVTNSLLDPVTANNSATVCTPVVIDNLAVTAFKAPKKVTLSAKKTNVVSKLSVTIQNRSLHAEVIPNLAVLSNLVTVTLTPIGTNSCPSPVAQLVSPKKLPPITLASGKSLKLAYTVNFTCATDPLATSKTANHGDYQYLVTVQHEALDGLADSRPADDVCPHDALGADPYNSKIKDKGCGLKIKGATTGTFTNVVTDIVDSRTP